MSEISLIYFDSLPSTNTYAKENINNLSLPSIIIANGQTAGRGRQGKSFFSPDGTGLYMTLVFEAPKNIGLLTPAAAVSVCKALEDYGISPKIKWVNDIFIENNKICGILTECFSAYKKTYIALGIGINLTTAVFPDDLLIAGSADIVCDKQNLARQISKNILEYVDLLNDKHIINEYRKRLFIIDKKITYSKNNINYSATVKDINEYCNLIVVNENGTTDILSSGEISIRI